jgi:hypothetical protein
VHLRGIRIDVRVPSLFILYSVCISLYILKIITQGFWGDVDETRKIMGPVLPVIIGNKRFLEGKCKVRTVSSRKGFICTVALVAEVCILLFKQKKECLLFNKMQARVQQSKALSLSF